MKKVECITRAIKLAQIKDALAEIGVVGMTVTDVRGCGQQKGRHELYRGNEYTVSLLPKIKITVATSDDKVEEVVKTMMEVARTGEIGDGKIFVQSLERVVRIRTGEEGGEAL
ncbi:MAG: P-II family nitrogen regulator [Fimbriimonadaceae bacterium]|nr:P-II family nitrogen regulator [Fimbriimonadaceae bacterium]